MDKENLSGGILIVDTINNEMIILLGKSNVPKRLGQYESFGGKKEDFDLTSLHTAIRELIEEFFNLKVHTSVINTLALKLREKKLILKQKEFFGMSYMINLNGLNEIYQTIISCDTSNNCMLLMKYNNDNTFNYIDYINERIITDVSKYGLNEIMSIHIIKVSDIKNKMYKLRWYTDKIISKMIKI